MASEFHVKKTLSLAFQDGINADGDPIIKRYSYSNIKKTATPDDLLATAQAIASLCKGTQRGFTTIDNNDLIL